MRPLKCIEEINGMTAAAAEVAAATATTAATTAATAAAERTTATNVYYNCRVFNKSYNLTPKY